MPKALEQQISTTDVLAAVRRSELLNADTLNSTLRNLDLNQCSSDEVLGNLVDNQLLTLWQARQLRKGRWRGFRLGKYQLLEELGRGGMARVYLARHDTLRNRVAIKVLSRSRLQKSSMVDRFLREARSAAQISHPNIVRVFDIDVEDDRHYLVMEYVKGWNLQELVENDGVLSYRKAAAFTLQAAQGLAHAHATGLVHRDIKPANLIVEEGTTVKISDFGLALVHDEGDDASLTMQHDEKVLGTADYIAPEQAINSHLIDARADQYSLGCTLYYMLTGQPPFPSGRIVERITKHCTVEPDGVATFRPDAPTELLEILRRMTRKKPHERYASMNLVAAALQQWLTESNGGDQLGTTCLATTTPSQTVLTTGPSSDVDDDLLTLAPEAEVGASVATKKTTAQKTTSAEADLSELASASPNALEMTEPLEALPENSLLDDAPTAGDSLAFSDLMDEWSDDASISATPTATGSNTHMQAELLGLPSGDLFSAASESNLRDTKVPGQTLITGSRAKQPPTEPTPTRFFAEMYEGFKRGEYPLWILIAAGVVLGAILLFVTFSYLTSFELPEVPVRTNET